jgi:hypothetical protein
LEGTEKSSRVDSSLRGLNPSKDCLKLMKLINADIRGGENLREVAKEWLLRNLRGFS